MAAARQYEINVSITDVATTMRTRFEEDAGGNEEDMAARGGALPPRQTEF
jgi:hypothetical protein